MKTINSMILTGMPVGSTHASVDRNADDDARVRREEERARLRRMQGEARRHADAEVRLADAMARASARTAQLARPSRVAPESATWLSSTTADDTEASVMVAAQMAKSVTMAEDEVLAAQTAVDAREALAAMPDPAGSLLQRLSLGQSRGLLRDCAPMLESIAAQWANRSRQPPAVGSRDGESLESALDFLQGYAEASTGRLADAERLAKLVMQVRQQMQASGVDGVSSTVVLAATSQLLMQIRQQMQVSGVDPVSSTAVLAATSQLLMQIRQQMQVSGIDAVSSTAVLAATSQMVMQIRQQMQVSGIDAVSSTAVLAAISQLLMQIRQQMQVSGIDAASSTALLAATSQQIAAQSLGKGHPAHNGKGKEHVNAVRKVRRDSDDQDSVDEGKLEAAGAAEAAAHAGADQGKVATVSESSLDKDQRKRRDDTLPLVTLRSI